MEILGTIRQRVDINPKDVILQLLSKEIGDGGVFERNGKFYLATEEYRNMTNEKEITEEKYRYVEALQLVLKNQKSKS